MASIKPIHLRNLALKLCITRCDKDLAGQGMFPVLEMKWPGNIPLRAFMLCVEV
jgi:hypothetical protein